MSNKPMAAYDLHRIKTLVDVLAMANRDKVLDLCREWGVQPVFHTLNYLTDKPEINYPITIRRLAQHALEHSWKVGE
jgi:hypothetical protein